MSFVSGFGTTSMDEYGFYDMTEEIAAYDEMARFLRLFWDTNDLPFQL